MQAGKLKHLLECRIVVNYITKKTCFPYGNKTMRVTMMSFFCEALKCSSARWLYFDQAAESSDEEEQWEPLEHADQLV